VWLSSGGDAEPHGFPTSDMQVRYSDAAAAMLSQMKARALANPASANGTVYEGVKRVLTDLLPVERRAVDRR